MMDIHEIRGSLFIGFLVIAGFLLILKVIVVVVIKDKIYDTPFYRDNLKRLRKINPELTNYVPLRRLDNLFSLVIAVSLSTALAHIIIGSIKQDVAAGVCIVFDIIAIFGLVACVYGINANMNIYLNEDNVKSVKYYDQDEDKIFPL